MNVLLLTPDAVGSTLLQRLITIYMQFHEFDQPVINLHELTNGIIKYYSPDFNREILGKPNRAGQEWGYFQSLREIVDMLSSVDHYKTSRLAEYHIKQRQDSIADQTPFYQYLNEKFFIISCRRRNLLEHALSWGLNKITKKLNVYSADEKISSFYDIYKNKVELDLEAFLGSLERYQSYLQWSENNFSISSYFYYEDHIDNIEKYILNLPVFSNQSQQITWKDKYNIDFSEWNLSHYYISNIGSLALDYPEQLSALTNSGSVNDQAHELLPINSKNLVTKLPTDQQHHIKAYLKEYITAQNSIQKMTELGILVTPVPIKKQTFLEKKFMIKNFDQCVSVFNQWAEQNSTIAKPYESKDLIRLAEDDLKKWQVNHNNQPAKYQQLVLPPID
jgi:hypothetical protein